MIRLSVVDAHSNHGPESGGLLQPAPRFEGLDLQNRMFRLESLVGRHEIDLLFLNDITEADSRAAIEILKSRARLDFSSRAVRSNTAWSETQLVVVTTSLPPIVRQELARSGKFGGVIISDATGEIGRLWQTGRRPALYRINRAGQVRYNQGAPLPEDPPTAPDAP
ncbi:MAG: hypothetical protein C0478_07090 [Planctomyces sp.]|nr:hypothetical protein [Planctomyces sp.]